MPQPNIEWGAGHFLRLPYINTNCCNDNPELDGSYGKHAELSWDTVGCGCCSSKAIDDVVPTKHGIKLAIAKMQEMKVAIDMRIAEFEKYMASMP